jgi:hypothetical protein
LATDFVESIRFIFDWKNNRIVSGGDKVELGKEDLEKLGELIIRGREKK